MPALKDRLLVAAYLVIAALPVIGIWWSVGQHRKLEGVTEAPVPVALTARSFASGAFQNRFGAWFEYRLAFKAVSVAIDNSLLYHAFDETKPGAQVVVGDGGVLYAVDDLAYLGLTDEAYRRGARAAGVAAKIARIQRALAAHGRGFVPVIVPSKTSLFRTDVPARWRSPVAAVPATDEQVYRTLVRELDARGVRYVDGRALVSSFTGPRDLIWGRAARHWTNYAACLAMQQVLVHHAALTSTPVVELVCEGSLSAQPRTHVDYDLWRLLNVWGAPRPAIAASVAHPPSPPGARRLSVVLAGTSFVLRWRDDGYQSGVFETMTVNFYDKTFYLPPDAGAAGSASVPVVPQSAQWRELMLTQDLIVLDLFETYALSSGAYDGFIVDELDVAVAH